MITTDPIANVTAALQEDGFVNASTTNLGGNVTGTVVLWDETTVLVTEDGAFLVGIYDTEAFDNGGEPTTLVEVQTVEDVIAAVNGALGIDD